MVSDDASKTPLEKSPVAGPARPPRRSRRGGRRHPRRPGQREPAQPPVPGAVQPVETPVDQPIDQPGEPLVPEIPRVPEAQPPLRGPSRLGSRLVPKSALKISAINQAIDQVNAIVVELRHALEQMDEVLETLELAERQKIEDEREVEALRRALRQLNESRGDDRERR